MFWPIKWKVEALGVAVLVDRFLPARHVLVGGSRRRLSLNPPLISALERRVKLRACCPMAGNARERGEGARRRQRAGRMQQRQAKRASGGGARERGDGEGPGMVRAQGW